MSNYRFHSPHIVKPWSNVDGRYVNVGATNNPANFGSNETSREFGLSGIINNAKAAAASVLSMKGGSRNRKNKISRKYTMATKKRSLFRRGKSMLMKMAKSVKSRFSHGKSRRTRRGGTTPQRPIRGGSSHVKPMMKGGKYGKMEGVMSGTPTMKGGKMPRVMGGTPMKGGYLQYGSNAAANASYSTGGSLSPDNLGLANPVPHQALSVNCPNAYRH